MSRIAKRAPWLVVILSLVLLLVLILGRWFTRPGQIFATVDRAAEMTAAGRVLKLRLALRYAGSQTPFWESASLPVGQRVGPIMAARKHTVLADVIAEAGGSERVTVPLEIRGSSRWYLYVTRGQRPTLPEVPEGWAKGLVALPLRSLATPADTVWVVWSGGVPLPSIS